MSTNNQNELMAQQFRSQLRKFSTASVGVESCALVTFDGLIRASVLGDAVDGDRFGAMSASLIALSTRASAELNRGVLRQIILDCELGPVILTQAGTAGVLAVASTSGANLGKLIYDTRATAHALLQIHNGNV